MNEYLKVGVVIFLAILFIYFGMKIPLIVYQR